MTETNVDSLSAIHFHLVICSLVCTLAQAKVTNTAESQHTYIPHSIWNKQGRKSGYLESSPPHVLIPFYFLVSPICPIKLNA